MKKVISTSTPPLIFIDNLEERAIPRPIMDLDTPFEYSNGPLQSGPDEFNDPKAKVQDDETSQASINSPKVETSQGTPASKNQRLPSGTQGRAKVYPARQLKAGTKGTHSDKLGAH